MTIFIDTPHTPWICTFAEVFQDAQIHVPGWNQVFRDQPLSVTVVSANQIRDQNYDAALEDCEYPSNPHLRTRRRISIVHLEQNLGDSACREKIQRIYSSHDFVVAVSEHKRFTLREFSSHQKTRQIGFVASDIPKAPLTSGLIGTVQNGMTAEKLKVWNAVAVHPDCVVIGHSNEGAIGRKVSPIGTAAYWSTLRDLSVYVNVVCGDSFGMASVEAMSLGIPFVTGISRDMPQEFISGFNCLIADDRAQRATSEITAFALELRNNCSLRSYLGTNARNTVLSVFPRSKFRRSFEEILS